MSGGMKAVAVLSALVAVGAGAGSLIVAFTKEAKRNSVDLSYGSVITPVEQGEVYTSSGGYDPVDIFARLNWTFAQQTEWYGEYSGYVNTVVTQDVHTYKYYKDGMLISADITESSLVNAAREFCYVKDNDRVLWREAAGGSSTYDKLDTPWQSGDPHRNMTISGENGFKAINGLPAYELSPYVIEPNTVLSSTVREATDEEYDLYYPGDEAAQAAMRRARQNGGTLYRADFVMNPEIWKDKDANGNEIVKGATAYYINQMIFTGGLPEAPEFTSLNITYYFDENWVTYATVVEENYSAAYGPIKAPCKGGGTTTYSYKPYNEADNPYPDAYEEYFQYYMDAAPDTDFERPITALDALAGAFGPLLAEPTTLKLDLSIGGKQTAGSVFVDLSKTDLSAFDVGAIEARVGLGALNLWVEGGKAYINYGGAKLSLTLSELLSLLTPAQPAAETEGEEGGGLNTDDLLGALANGEFKVEEGKAELHSKLPLLGYEIPIDFYFNVDAEKKVTLDRAAVSLDLDGLALGADISFGGEAIPALKEGEKADYIELVPHIQSLIDLFTSPALHADLGYEGHGVQVEGGIDIAVSPFALKGDIAVKIPAYNAEKKISLVYQEGAVYLDLDGIRLRASIADAGSLISKYLDFSSLTEGGLSLDIGGVVEKLLSSEFAQNIIASKEESKLHLLLRGTNILQALGIDFALGDVSLEIAPESLSLGALGISATLTKGEAFTFTPEGYTDIVPYAARIAKLVSGGYLAAEVSYTGETLSVTGGLTLDVKKLAAKGTFTLSYMGTPKTLEVLYADGELYLTVDGLRIKANVKEAIDLVKEFVKIPSGDSDALKIVADLFALDFSKLIKLSEEEDTLTLTVAGTDLLHALGLSFDLGDIALSIEEKDITLTAEGISAKLKAGESFEYSVDGYSEIVPYAKTILDIYQSGFIALNVNVPIGSLCLAGRVDIDLGSFNVAATLSLISGSKQKDVEIFYEGGEIFLAVDNIRLKVNVEEGAELLGGLLDLGSTGEEIDAIKALLGANFSELIPELWESDGALHITVASGKLLSLFGVSFDLGDLRLAVDGEGAVAKLGKIVLTAAAGAPFEGPSGQFLDITDYLGAVATFANAKSLTVDVSYDGGEKFSLKGAIDILLDGTAAQGNLTLTANNKEGGKAEHAISLLWTKEENIIYLAVDGIKLRANVEEAVGLVKSLIQKVKPATARGRASDGETQEEEALTVLEKLLSFDLGEFFALAEERDETSGTLTLTVKGTELLSVLGLSLNLGDVDLSLDTDGHISLHAMDEKLVLSVHGGEGFEKQSTDGYVDIVAYGQYLLDLFDNNTYKVTATYQGKTLKVRADVSFDTEKKLAVGSLILIYKEAAKEISFAYEEGWFYLALGDSYRLKAKTAGALALIAGYLGLSEDGVTWEEGLDKALTTTLDGLLTLHETGEGDARILTVLLDGSALLKALGIDFDLGEVDLQVAKNYLYASVKGVGVEVIGNGVTLPDIQDRDSYTDLSGYLDSVVNVFKQDYITLDLAYGESADAFQVTGTLSIDVQNKQARADITVKKDGTEISLGIVYDKDGYIYLNLDGAKIKASAQQIIDRIKGLFSKNDNSEQDSGEPLGRRLSARTPLKAALTEDQKSKLLGILETILSLNLDDYFTLSEKDNALSIVLDGTGLLAKLLKKDEKDISLGDITVEVKGGALTLTVLGATITATGSNEGFTALTDEEKAGYADIIKYVGYITELFKSDILKLHIENLSVQVGDTVISAEGDIDIKTDGSLAGGTLTLKVGGKSLTLTLYYENAEKRTFYLELGDVKLKASIEDIKTLIDKLKNKEPAAAHALRLAAIFAENDLFGANVEDGVFSLALNGKKLVKLLGLDIALNNIALTVKEGSLGVSASSDKFGLDATLSKANSIEFDTPENKASYVDLVKYVDYAVDLFRKDAFEIGLSFTKGEFTITGSSSFAPKSKVASGEFTITYGTTSKHAEFAYQDGTAYIALDGSNGVMKFKAKSAASVALLAAYFGFSGTDKTLTNTFTDAFQGVFTSFDSLFALSENAEKDVLTLLVNGTELLKKLKISLGSFELGDIGVKLGKDNLVLSVLGLQVTLRGTDTAPVLPTEEELAGYIDLSDYADTLAALASSEYLGISISYTSKDTVPLSVRGDVYIAVKEKNIRANVTIEKDKSSIVLGVVYTGGKLYIDLDGAKIALDAKEAVSYLEKLIKGTKGRARSVRNAPTAILNEEQTNKLLSVLKDLFTLELDNFFTVEEGEGGISILLNGTGLLQKLLKKEIALGDVKLTVGKSVFGADGTVEKCGDATLEALGATIVLGRSTQFTVFSEDDSADEYADILEYIGYITELFKSDILKLHIQNLSMKVGETEITASGDIDIKTDGSLAGGTLNLKVGGKSLTLTLYYEKTDGTFYLELGGVKLKASIEDIRDLIDKLKNKEPAAAHALRLAATIVDNNLFGVGVDVENNILDLVINGGKLTKLLGLDIALDNIALKVAQGSLGVSASSDKFGLDATLSEGADDSFKDIADENKKDYVDLVKYVDYAVDLFRHKAYDLTISYAKNDLTIEGTVSFDTESKTAKAALNLGYKSAKKHLDLIYKDGYLYLTLAKGNKEEFKFKANTASAVALILGYLGVSGTDILPDMKMPDDVFGELFADFDEFISLSESEEINEENNEVNYVLTLLVNGTELLEKLKISLGNFDLGNIGVQLKKDSLALTVLGANLTLTGIEKVTLGEFKEADYVDLSAYVDSVVNIFKQKVITLAVDYDDNGVAVEGSIRIDVQNKQARADITVKKDGTEISLGIVYDSKGVIYLNLDGAKIKAKAQDILDLVEGLFSKKDSSEQDSGDPLGRRLSRTPLKAALTEDQKSKLLGILETILSLNLDDYFELAEERGENGETDSLTLTVKGTELLAKLLGKDIKLGNVDLKVENGGALTLTVLGATITATGSEEGFVLFDEGDGAANYTDVLQYIQWAADIFAQEAKKVELTITSGDLSVGLTLNVIKGNAFMQGEITLTYKENNKDFNFVYEKNGGESGTEGWIYLDLDGVRIKAKTDDIVALLKSLFKNATGEEADSSRTRALGYAAAAILNADEMAFGAFSLTEKDSVLTLTLSGEKLMSLLGEKVQSLLGDKFSLESVGLSISEKAFTVEADAAISGSSVDLTLDISKGEKTSLTEEEKKELASYIDVFKYGKMVKDLFTESKTLQAEISAELFGQDVDLTLKFNKDFTMAKGTLKVGSIIDLGLIYVLKESKTEGEKDVVLYIKVGENVKLMANVSEVIRIIRSAKGDGETKGRARSAAPIALTTKQEEMLGKFLGLKLSDIIALTEKIATEGDSLEIAIKSKDLLGLLGIDFDLGTVNVNISEGELMIALPDKAGLTIDLYDTSRTFMIEESELDEYRDITPIVSRVVELIEAQAIEFSGDLVIGDLTLTIERGVFSWKDGENKKFYLKASLGDIHLELLIVGENATLKVGSFGVKFAFSDIGDLIEAVKGLIAKVKATIADIKENITGTFNRDDLVGSLQGIADVLTNIVDFLGGSKDAAAAAVTAKEVLDMGGMRLSPSALTPEGNKKVKLFGFSLGKLTIELFDETDFDERGLLGLGLTIGDTTAPTLSATVNTAIFTGEFPEIAGAEDFYDLREFIEMLGYAGDAVALVSERNLTAKIGGNVMSTNTAMYTTAGNEGLVYDITGNMDYASGDSFPIHLDMDGNNLWVNTDFFLHFNLYIKAGTQQTMVNGSPVDTTPKNLYIDIFITDCDLAGEQNGELDFFVSISQIGEGNEGYNPLKLYAPAKEILTILSGVASILGMDAVTYVNQYLIQPLLDEDMVARLKGLGVSLVPTILDMLLKDTDETEGSATIANNVPIPEDAFGVQFGNVKLHFKSEKDGDNSYLALLGITTEEEEKSGDATYTKTTDLAFAFERKVEYTPEQKKPTVLTGFFDIEGVDELVLALARTATHKATAQEVEQGIAKTGEYVRNDLFFVDGLLHLDLSIIGINIETININVLGLTVNFDANNQISLNAKLSYDGVYNALAGLAGDSTIINGDTVLDLTIANGMLYMRREQTSDFGGRNHDWRPLGNESIVIYRAMPLANFAKDTTTMMDNICFMFNLSKDLISTIMGSIGGGTGGGTAAAPSDIGGLFYKYINSCTYEDQGDTNGLVNLLYTLVLNGAGLTNSDSFGNITVKLGVEKGVLRSIEIPKFSIASVVNINANLRLRNPEYVWDDGYSDLTQDIAEQLKRGMDAKLQKVDWNATTYLEGQFTTVTYKLQDQVLGTQDVVFEPNTKELYATLSYPDIESFLNKNPSFRQDGYTYEWVKPNPNDFKAGMTISAKAQANKYDLVFIIEEDDVERYQVTVAELEAAGYSWDDEYNAYVHIYHWTYDPENYIDLPYITTKVGKIIGFRCPNDNLHNEDHRGLDFYDRPTVEYRAEWEYIDYTVTFDFGNGTSEGRTGHYEDPLNYPDAPTRTGYTFAGWDVTVSSFTGNMTIHAKYTPNTYQITLVSEYAIDGFTPRADGKYEKTIDYVYNTQTDLPVNIRADGFILNGWSLTAEDTGTHFTQLPAIAENREIYAVWDIIGFDIRFVVKAADSTTGVEQEIAVKNFKYDDVLANLPEVPQKDGYTGAWDIPADYTVSGEDTIYAVYTGIHYYITEYSLYAIAGYTEVKGEFDSEGVQGSSYWKKTYEYVYGSTPHPLTLGVSENVYGYDFKGYYTERFGQGTKIDDNLIDDDMIRDIFHFNVGDGSTLEEQNVLYVYWEDNSVEVHLYSDVDFADKTGHDVDGYYKSLMKMEGDYDISGETITPNEKEIQQIGWWYNDPEKGWRKVTDVGVFRNHDNKKQATVKLFALWVTDIKVSITTLVDKNSTYDIGGNAQGGEVYPGGKSAEIYEKTGMTNPMTGIFKICGRTAEFLGMGGNWTEDTLQSGAVFNIDRGEGGSFLKTGMMSFNAVTWQDSSMHGGVIITVKFTMKDGTVAATTTWTSIVSFHTYDVRVLDENGNELKKEAVRLDYDRDEYDNAVYTRDVLEGSTLHSFSGVEIPKKEGYTGYWTINGVEITGNEKITGATEIRAAYKPNLYPVEFNDLDDCDDAAKSYLQSTKELAYGTQIFFVADGATIANYTVGLENNIFAVPAMVYSGAHAEGYTGKWHLTENAAGKVTFTAVYEAILQEVVFTVVEKPNDGRAWQQSEGKFTLDCELPYDTVIRFTENGAETAAHTVKLTGSNTFALPEREGYTASYSVTKSGNVITVEVTYVEKTFNYTIKFHYNDGTETVDEVPYTAHFTNTTYEVTSLEHNVSRDYYDFVGWYFDDACEKLFDKWPAEPNKTLDVYAGWKVIEYTIVYESQGLDGAEFTNPNDKVWKDGVEITLKEASYSGYAFDGWFTTDGTEVTKIDKDNAKQYIDEATSTITLYAKFHKDTVYNFNYNVSEKYGDLTCTETASARVGETITLPAYDTNGVNKHDYDVKKQWYFAGWKLPNDESLYELGAVVTITADHVLDSSDDAVTITAVWKEKVVLTVTLTKENGRIMSADTPSYTLDYQTSKDGALDGKDSQQQASNGTNSWSYYIKPDEQMFKISFAGTNKHEVSERTASTNLTYILRCYYEWRKQEEFTQP